MYPTASEKNLPSTRKTNPLVPTKKGYEYFERMQEHLKENGLNLEETDYIVGRNLEFDAKTETIKGDAEANAST
jgi:hypothetical protein